MYKFRELSAASRDTISFIYNTIFHYLCLHQILTIYKHSILYSSIIKKECLPKSSNEQVYRCFITYI